MNCPYCDLPARELHAGVYKCTNCDQIFDEQEGLWSRRSIKDERHKMRRERE